MSGFSFACERTAVRGMPIFLESSHALPVVDIALRIATGAEFDPEGLEGLARLTLKTLRMGPEGMSEQRTEDLLAGLGARKQPASGFGPLAGCCGAQLHGYFFFAFLAAGFFAAGFAAGAEAFAAGFAAFLEKIAS